MQNKINTPFTADAKIEYPIICGAMYPCSNPELVASASEAGAIGIVQPLSLVYVHGYDFREGLKKIKSMTSKPFGMNVLVEQSSEIYKKRMQEWVDIALEEGCRFFITALGNPSWVVNQVKPLGGIVYHDVTERKWALKAIENGVDGLICVNNRAGGHAGSHSPQQMYDELYDLQKPLICAGGISTPQQFKEALDIGYAGIQMGTRFIATYECVEKENYKDAIIRSDEKDIVLTERITGVPVSVIRTPYVEKMGTKVNPLERWLLKNSWTKSWMRMWFAITSGRKFKQVTLKGGSSTDYWQAGKSVSGIHEVKHVKDIVNELVDCIKHEAN